MINFNDGGSQQILSHRNYKNRFVETSKKKNHCFNPVQSHIYIKKKNFISLTEYNHGWILRKMNYEQQRASNINKKE